MENQLFSCKYLFQVSQTVPTFKLSVTLSNLNDLFPPALRCDRHRYVAMCSTWTRCVALSQRFTSIVG